MELWVPVFGTGPSRMMKKKITKREWRLALFKDEIINSQYDKRYLVLALSRSLTADC